VKRQRARDAESRNAAAPAATTLLTPLAAVMEEGSDVTLN